MQHDKAEVSDKIIKNEINATNGYIYGNHEIQVSEGEEADLHKYFIDCKKNPGHARFIPVDRFNVDHLPVGHRDADLYEYIKVAAELTVRVDVKLTSPHRPKFWPRSSIPYPFYGMREKTFSRTGSGMLTWVNRLTSATDHPDASSHVWWEFVVDTATHVVFDDAEAKQTTLRLFYDTEQCPVVSVDQVSILDVDIEKDWCLLKCVTREESLASRLTSLWTHFRHAFDKVNNKYKRTRDEDRLTFLVSHPHGCSKRISIGHWNGVYPVGQFDKRFTYTADTCPGSSGAPVHCVGYSGESWWSCQLVHSGSSDSGLNYSGAGYVI